LKKILVWETLSLVSGGQRMTLTVLDLMKDTYSYHCLIPEKGPLAEELDARGIPYTLMGNQTMPTGVKGKSVIFKYAWMSLKAVCKALSVIRREKPDILYAPGPASLPWSAFCGSLTGKPVIWHLHHIFIDGTTKKLLNICSGWKSVNTIISVSNFVGEQITNKKAQNKKVTLYNPVDIEKYANGRPDKVIQEFPYINANSIMIGHIGLLQPSKRQDIAIDIVETLHNKGHDAHALIVGSARAEDKPYEASLRQTVRAKGLEKYIHFLGQRNDIENIMKILSVIFVPSMEGLSLVALEAMAAGVPILATSQGGVGELIRESGAGCLFNEEDTLVDIADKILFAIGEKGKITNGIVFVNSHNPERYRADILRIFKI